MTTYRFPNGYGARILGQGSLQSFTVVTFADEHDRHGTPRHDTPLGKMPLKYLYPDEAWKHVETVKKWPVRADTEPSTYA